MNHKALYILIAMWLWCVAAAGESLPITTQSLMDSGYENTLNMPCNWDQSMSEVKLYGVYADPGTSNEVRTYSILDKSDAMRVPITPVSMAKVGTSQIHMALDPGLPQTHQGKYLYHLELDFKATNKRCKSGFGFGTMTR